MSLDTRVAALDGLLEEAGLDAVLATKDASIAYLTGFWGLQLERFFGVAVKRGGGGALIAPSLDRESVAAAPTGAGQDPLQRRRLQRAARAVRDARRRQAHRRRGGPPQLRAREGADRGRVRARPRDRRGHAPARGQGGRGGRGRPARVRSTSRPPTTSCGRGWRSATPRPRPTRASRTCSPAAARRTPSRTSSSAPTPRTRTARRASASSRPATSSAPTSPRSSTATGAT